MVRMLGYGLIVLSTLAAVSSVVLHLTTPWTKTTMGRHLMAYSGVIAAVLTTWTLGILFQIPPWFDYLRFAVFACVPVVLWWRVGLQWSALRTRRPHNQQQ